MIGPDVGDLSPVALVVARGALGPDERSFVRIFVAGDAVGLQSEEARGAAPIPAVVAILAGYRTVSALQRPTRLAMVEPLLSASGPAHELRVSSEVLHVASAARLLPILPRGVQALPFTDPDAEVVMTSQTGVGIETFAGRVAFAAVRVAVDLGMGSSQLTWRKELRSAWSRRECTADRGCDHDAGQERKRGDSAFHWEKIQR